MLNLCYLILVGTLVNLIHGHHVLVFHNLGTKSHLLLLTPIMDQLLADGNKVTAILFNSVGIEHENFTEILLPTDVDAGMEQLSKVVMQKPGLFDPRLWKFLYEAATWDVTDVALNAVRPAQVQQLIKKRPRVDAVVTMWSTGTIFAEVFDCPIILFSPNTPFMIHGTTNVINYSVQPLIISPFIEPMTLMQRLINHALVFYSQQILGYMSHQFHKHQSAFLEKELGIAVRSPDLVLEERVAIMLTSSHPVTHGAWPYLPNIIEVGGLQLRPPRPLPSNLQTLLDSANDGAVLVSFGGSLRAEHMAPHMIKIFLDVFCALKLPVIWRWEGDLDDPPPNLLTMPWLPQQDVLAHRNLKVMLTHGGLGSLVEAIQHKVVIVGVPLSTDQRPNILRAEKLGYALHLEWGSLTVSALLTSLLKAVEDSEMRKSIKQVKARFLDRPTEPAKKAAWWVNHVCRHRGTPWLKTYQVPFYQRAHLDLLLLLLAGISTIAFPTIFCCRSHR